MAKQKPPYRGTPSCVILYCPDGEWRFAIAGSNGFLDGRIDDVAADDLDEAQGRALAVVQLATGKTFHATWKESEPDWWIGELAPD